MNRYDIAAFGDAYRVLERRPDGILRTIATTPTIDAATRIVNALNQLATQEATQ